MSTYNKLIGAEGENYAADYLKSQGYEILERNFRCRYGEIDIIARDGSFLVFVEVKTRSNISRGVPSCAVTKLKQKTIILVAQSYIISKKISGKMRFDVVEVMASLVYNDFFVKSIKVIKNAFGIASESY